MIFRDLLCRTKYFNNNQNLYNSETNENLVQIDEDYDFPNPTEEEDDHELMDYDEPSVSFHQVS